MRKAFELAERLRKWGSTSGAFRPEDLEVYIEQSSLILCSEELETGMRHGIRNYEASIEIVECSSTPEAFLGLELSIYGYLADQDDRSELIASHQVPLVNYSDEGSLCEVELRVFFQEDIDLIEAADGNIYSGDKRYQLTPDSQPPQKSWGGAVVQKNKNS